VGGDSENPSFKVAPFGRITAGTPTVISATLEGVSAGDVRDMWLHVSTPEGQWRRFAMNVVHAPGGVVGTALFPAAQLDTRGRARLYASLSTRSGEELFTDIQSVLGPSAASTAGAR